MPDLSTRNQRKKLKPRGAPYWQRLARGRSLGYVSTNGNKRPGIWHVRFRVGGEKPYRFKSLGVADDLPHLEADGDEVLTYADALEKAARWDPFDDEPQRDDDEPTDETPGDDEPRYEPGTVGEVVQRYLAWYKKHRRSYERVKYQMEAHVLPVLGDVPLDRLSANRLRRWHEKLSEKPAHVRTSKHGKKRKVRHAKTEDDKRARKVTANRVLSVLKAALHRKWLGGKRVVGPWSEVVPFVRVNRSRIRYLDTDEAARLVNGCDPDFRELVLGAIYSGARYGELAAMRVEDLRVEAGGVFVVESKNGKSRTIYLNDEALAFFEGLAAGRDGDELIFRRADSEPWGKNHQQKRIRAACKAAKIKPRVLFHELRHTYASLYLMAGGGLPDLAKQLGHTSTRMVEDHYGHLSDAWRAERARQFAPTLVLKPSKVRRLAQVKT